MVIKALVVDDSDRNRSNLISLLKRHVADVRVIGEASNIKEAQDELEQQKPDLVFLDIRMPGGNAFDLLELIGSPDFEIIFVTAYDEYALQAFQFNAIDYLLKPIDYLALNTAVEKARRKIELEEENRLLRNFMENQNRDALDKRIPLPTDNRVEFIPVKEIVRCMAESNYTHFFMTNGRKLMICKTLKEYEKSLVPFGFIRIHQSHLINSKEIRALVRRDGGYIEMTDGTVLPISKTRKDSVTKVIDNL